MKKTPAARFTISVPRQLARQLDEMLRQKGYTNRSLAIADMIRAQLVEHRQQQGQDEIAGSITLVYDHHRHHLQELLTDLQHEHRSVIISTLHCHLDEDNCLEVLAVRGKAPEIKRLADELIGAKGVKHGKLTITTTGKDLP
ncbi:MAG: nickel-responsive transcriptional regulator NikR [Verrucomicrobiae bacterium]|nr:nickel-responsive transcriptional regulator NikR [Verrucomicrobiae bacterium]